MQILARELRQFPEMGQNGIRWSPGGTKSPYMEIAHDSGEMTKMQPKTPPTRAREELLS